jgi:NAD(P)-dependent dehydrogenase (short-subunit alcohol dehydrogenase family)
MSGAAGMSLFDLTGQVAVVTGASRGIGRAIALRMAQHGARVVVSSRKLDACQAVVDEITAAGGEAFAQACNIGRKEELRALVDATLARWGRIDTAVCNAAINPHFGPSSGLPDEVFDKVMATNIKSNLWLSNMVMPGMAERGGGSVIVISSIAGFRGTPVLGAYGISKAADMQLVRNPRGGMGAAQRPRELHRAGPGPHRFRAGAVGGSGDPPQAHPRHAAAAHRGARRDRRRRGVPRLRRRQLHDRPDDRDRWWRPGRLAGHRG